MWISGKVREGEQRLCEGSFFVQAAAAGADAIERRCEEHESTLSKRTVLDTFTSTSVS